MSALSLATGWAEEGLLTVASVVDAAGGIHTRSGAEWREWRGHLLVLVRGAGGQPRAVAALARPALYVVGLAASPSPPGRALVRLLHALVELGARVPPEGWWTAGTRALAEHIARDLGVPVEAFPGRTFKAILQKASRSSRLARAFELIEHAHRP